MVFGTADVAQARRTVLDAHRARAWERWRHGRRSLTDRLERRLRLYFRAAVRNPGVLLTLLFGLVAVLQIVLQRTAISVGWLIVSASIILLVVVFLSGFWSLRYLPPDEFALLVLGGRRAPEIFEEIAVRAHELCRRFVDETVAVSAFLSVLESHVPSVLPDPEGRKRVANKLRAVWTKRGPDGVPQGDAKCDAIIAAIKDLRVEQDPILRRLDALKVVAADELDIPARRLCDHILQFSPAILRAGVEKYHQNWQEMKDLVDRLGRADLPRFVGLMHQLRRLEDECREVMGRQQDLLRFADLHEDIHRLAATRSTSGSLQAYARAITLLAQECARQLGDDAWDGDPRSSLFLETLDKFQFLYRKQRAHPGFDLHTLLSEVLETLPVQYVSERLFDDEVVATQKVALVAIARSSLDEGIEDGPKGDREVVDTRLEFRHRFLGRLEALSRVQAYMNRAVSLSRDSMYATFRRLVSDYCASLRPKRRLFLVTSGYSKTARELVLRVFREPMAELPAGACLFLLLGGDGEDWETRLMRWDLRPLLSRREANRGGRPASEPRPCRLASGNDEMLAALCRSGDRCLFVLGAEAIDVLGTIAHPRAAVETIRRAVGALRDAHVEVKVVVAAEHYKLQATPFAATAFCAEHYERAGFYPRELVDHVLSDAPRTAVQHPWLNGRLLTCEEGPARRSSSSKRTLGTALPP